jgi:thiamine-monophosphate kinase
VRPGPLTSPDSGKSAPADVTVADAGERALIDRIARRLPPPPSAPTVGIGDDAAIVEPDRGALTVLTTDALVEGIHFDRRYSSPRDIGYKALAVNVSDVAAMGGSPRYALLSLILPASLGLDELDGIVDGLIEMAAATKMALVGGNITRSPGPLVIDVTVTGSVRRRRILTRGGGRPGDQLFVTGTVGAAAAGLDWLRHRGGGGALPDDPALADCVTRHRRPEPRARIGAALGASRAASACMDLSDGLADAVTQVAAASGTGARVDAALLPLHPGALAWWTACGEDPIRMSVSGGDDYELLFAVSSRAKGRLRQVKPQQRGVPITRIGELTAGPGVTLDREGRSEAMPSGFVHF